MNGKKLLEISVPGIVSTNSNRQRVFVWRQTLDGVLTSTFFPVFEGRKISVKLTFWINENRLKNKRNDLDNLSKPVLDSLIRSRIIVDDSDIFHLEATKCPTEGEEEVQIMVREWN